MSGAATIVGGATSYANILVSGSSDNDDPLTVQIAESLTDTVATLWLEIDSNSGGYHGVVRCELHIDLSGIGSELTFIGTGSYTGTTGEVRYNDTIGRLYIDTDGDRASEFSVNITGAPVIDINDLPDDVKQAKSPLLSRILGALVFGSRTVFVDLSLVHECRIDHFG